MVYFLHMERKKLLTTIAGLFALVAFIGGGFWLKHNQKQNPTAVEPIAESEIKLSVKSVEESNSYYAITAEYPQFEGVAPIFNQSIEKTVMDAIADHKMQAEDNQKSMIALDISEGREPRKIDQYELYVKWEQVQINANYISFVMRIGGFTGGAHGYENIVTFNYDVKNQKIVSLADMFPGNPNYLVTLSEYSRKELRSSLGDYANETFIMDGTQPNDLNFKNFTFTDNVVTIYFTQYQVAPYVAGEQRINYSRTAQ